MKDNHHTALMGILIIIMFVVLIVNADAYENQHFEYEMVSNNLNSASTHGEIILAITPKQPINSYGGGAHSQAIGNQPDFDGFYLWDEVDYYTQDPIFNITENNYFCDEIIEDYCFIDSVNVGRCAYMVDNICVVQNKETIGFSETLRNEYRWVEPELQLYDNGVTRLFKYVWYRQLKSGYQSVDLVPTFFNQEMTEYAIWDTSFVDCVSFNKTSANAGGTVLLDFTVLHEISNNSVNLNDFWSSMAAGGISIANGSCANPESGLDYEIENVTNETIILHFLDPYFTAGENEYSLWYDNLTIIADSSDSAWADHYKLMLLMPYGALQYNDSTQYNNDIFEISNATGDSNGFIDGGILSDINTNLNVSNTSYFGINNNATHRYASFGGCYNISGVGVDDETIIMNDDNSIGAAREFWGVRFSNYFSKIWCGLTDDDGTYDFLIDAVNDDVRDGAKHCSYCVADYDDNNMYLYTDGIQVNTSAISDQGENTPEHIVGVGSYWTNTLSQPMNGTIDYVMFSNAFLLAGFFNQTWEQKNSHDSLTTVAGTSLSNRLDFQIREIQLLTGTYLSGTEASTFIAEDGLNYSFDEDVGTPGFDVIFNLTDVILTSGFNYSIRYNYSGSDGHDVNLNVWNYTSSEWVLLSALTDGSIYFWENSSGLNYSATDVLSDNVMLFGINHSSSGNTNHLFYLDYFRVNNVSTITTTTTTTTTVSTSSTTTTLDVNTIIRIRIYDSEERWKDTIEIYEKNATHSRRYTSTENMSLQFYIMGTSDYNFVIEPEKETIQHDIKSDSFINLNLRYVVYAVVFLLILYILKKRK